MAGLKSNVEALARKMLMLGIDPRKTVSLKKYPLYLRQRREWRKQGGEISANFMVLSDYADNAGTAKGHYFHQDLLVARLIASANPKRHVDVGSRIDGFVAHVAAFREIDVVDIRPLGDSVHENITFVQADLMQPGSIGKTDSLSCLHAIEHFGMGRYTDPIDVMGHEKGVSNLVELVEQGGHLYISFPIGAENEVHFNAHRVFHPEWILNHSAVSEKMLLKRFDYVDDAGDLHLDKAPSDAVGSTKFGCGIYTFVKK